MEIEFFEWGGATVTVEQFDDLVQRVCDACLENSSCEIVELKRDPGQNTQSIIADFADGTFSLDNSVGIERVERLCITYTPENEFPWEVRALRKSFPVTTHQNHVLESEPRSLCLYIEPWLSVERSWTPELFLRRIFWWLRETANETIHGDDQPLEQVFFSSPYKVVLPEDYFTDQKTWQKKISFQAVENNTNDAETLIGEYADTGTEGKLLYVSVSVLLDPIENGPIEDTPQTLGQLQMFLENRGGGIIDSLKSAIVEQVDENGINVASQEGKLVLLLIGIPRVRNGAIEKIETQGFIVDSSFAELGERLNVLFKLPNENKWYRDSLNEREGNEGLSLPIFPVSISTYPSREDIRQFSGIPRDDSGPNGVIAGVGALGGMIAKIWGRECWGQWICVDDDVLKPHNFVRHIASRYCLGYPKAKVVDSVVNGIHDFAKEKSFRHIIGSVISDGPEIVTELEGADFLVDVTTTLYVPREFSRREEFPRTASVFVTPSGLSSVMLLEDAERNIRCNSLEAQYYRAILNSEWGSDHLSGHLGRFWVGAGCREATNAISNELIHLHGAILSRQIRKSSLRSLARICVWNYQDDVGGVQSHDIQPSPVHSIEISGWEVSWDRGFLIEAKEYRDDALPNETGGLLFGIIDQKDKSITLVKACPAPDNSISSPASFMRGAYEQPDILENCHERTAGVVTYVGDWHSHPKGCAALPSHDDIAQLEFLSDSLQAEGMPALMLIISDTSLGLYIDGQGITVDFEAEST